jgi:glucans biosynthesis protein C
METSLAQVKQRKSTARLVFADNLRTTMIILVVIYHVAVIYAANTAFYYLEKPTNAFALELLVLFQLLNTAFFMGLLFLLSGYFTPQSYEHKGLGAFLKDRLVRFGIPLIVGTLVLYPLAYFIGIPNMSASLLASSKLTPSNIMLPLTWQNYFQFINIGVLWFVVLLLIFDIGYAAWRWVTRSRTTPPVNKPSLPTYTTIGAFILVLAATSFLVRLVAPIGHSILQFPSLSYLPEYLSFFLIGIVAYRGDWLRTISGSMAKRVFAVALAATIILFLPSLAGDHFLGGLHWQSVTYVLWDSIFAVGMSMGMIVFFRRYFNQPGRLGQFLSKHSYTVYIIHPLLLTILAAIVLKGVALPTLLKFILAVVIAVPLCFAIAYLVRKIPYADRVL